MARRAESPLSSGLRFVLEVVFWYTIWMHFGWGYGLIALIVIASTGVVDDKRMIMVPVPGWVRVAFELLLAVFGTVAGFSVFGVGWGVLLLFVVIAYHLLAVRRFHSLLRR